MLKKLIIIVLFSLHIASGLASEQKLPVEALEWYKDAHEFNQLQIRNHYKLGKESTNSTSSISTETHDWIFFHKTSTTHGIKNTYLVIEIRVKSYDQTGDIVAEYRELISEEPIVISNQNNNHLPYLVTIGAAIIWYIYTQWTKKTEYNDNEEEN